jgi:hypothetical protein
MRKKPEISRVVIGNGIAVDSFNRDSNNTVQQQQQQSISFSQPTVVEQQQQQQQQQTIAPKRREEAGNVCRMCGLQSWKSEGGICLTRCGCEFCCACATKFQWAWKAKI